MAEGLQQIRKAAGYRAARDFAEAHGISVSTYARYESDPAGIPLKSAWKIADALECTIDDVVGRTAPGKEKGGLQERFETLDEEGRMLVAQIVEFAEMKQAEREQRAYDKRFSEYFVAMYREAAKAGNPILAQDDGPAERRARFTGYLRGKIAEKGLEKAEEAKEFEGIMQAFNEYMADIEEKPIE